MVAARSALAPVASRWTNAPGGVRWVALYDGDCRFCTKQVRQFQRLVGRERVQPVSFQEEGVLARFPGVSYAACMKRMHVVRPDGRVFAGAEAVARAVTMVPVVGWIAFLYYVPGLRQLVDLAYRAIAKRRYRIAGREGGCDGGACSLHE